MRLRSRALNTVLGISYHLRAPIAWDVLRGGRVKILMYHGVPTRDRFEGIVNHYGYNVPVAEFEQQLRYLRRRCNVVGLRDLLAGRGLSRTRTNVVLTFDDGYENNATNAFEVLSRLGLPAVFALPTAFAPGGEPLYNDVVEYAVQSTELPDATIRWQGQERAFPLGDDGERLALYNWLMDRCVNMDQAQRGALIAGALQALEVAADPDRMFENEDYRPMTGEQIARLGGSDLIELASHSVHHYLLAHASPEARRDELLESKNRIEELTGEPCTAFCVPGGSYDDDLLELATELGYDCVLTSDPGTARSGARVLNRNGVFRRELAWFADIVHGPVYEMLGAVRRARSSLRGGAAKEAAT